MRLKNYFENLFKKDYVLQNGAAECGVACLSTIFKFHKHDIGYEYIKEQCGADSSGATMLGLMEASRSCGFEAEGFRIKDLDLIKNTEDPIILPVTVNEHLNHYYVYYGVKKGKHIIMDPATGKKSIDEELLLKEWKSRAILKITPLSKDGKVNSIKSKTKSQIFDILKKDISFLYNILFIGLIIAIINISISIFLQKLVDNIIPDKNWELFYLAMVVFAILLMIRSALSYYNTKFLLKQSFKLNIEQIKLFFNKIFNLPWKTIKSRRTGDFIARLNDSAKIQQIVLKLFGSTSVQLLILISSITAVSFYNKMIGGFILICFTLYSVIYSLLFKSINSAYRNVMSNYAANENNYINTLQGMDEINSFQAQRIFQPKTVRIYQKFQDSTLIAGQVSNKLNLFNGIVGGIFLIGMFTYTSVLTLNGQLTTGEMVAIISLSNFMLPALSNIINSITQIQEAGIALNRIDEFTNSYNSKDENESKPLSENIEKISFEDISFRFPGKPVLFSNISFNINKGEWVSVLGENGTGKSTIFKLILDFLEPNEGDIKINNKSNKIISKESVLNQIGYCPQEIHLFNGSVIYNICFSDEIEVQKKTIKKIEELGLHNLFKKFPQGLLTIVGEGGVQISGGQKQLIGITRALIKEPAILLLDEPTTAMDKNTRNFILNLLSQNKERRCTLIITHEANIAAKADRLYILEGNSLKYGNNPEQLLKEPNFFSDSVNELREMF